MITADLLEKIIRPDGGELDRGRDWETVKCPYCLDNHHLAVEGAWIVHGIPADVEAARYYLPARSLSMVYLPCDCLMDGWDFKTEQKQPRTFREYFGEPIRTHWYGRRLMTVRHAMQQALTAGYRPGDDGHYHLEEAWEVMERQPDPPEPVLEVMDYAVAGATQEAAHALPPF